MTEKKSWIYEMLESDEIRKYFINMLNNQTEQVKNYISNTKKQLDNEELEQYKNQLENLKNANEEYRKEIKDSEDRIVRANEIIDVQTIKIHELQHALRNVTLTIQEKEKRISELEVDNKSIEHQNLLKINEISEKLTLISDEKQKIEHELETYCDKYCDIDNSINIYRSLSFETKKRLHNIIRNDSIFSIIGASSDWRNIEGLWEFAKRRVIDKEYEDAQILYKLFEFLLNAYNAQYSENRYELIKPMVGDKFDSDIHSIIGIQTDGFIKTIRLSGIKKNENNKIVRKALIEV